MTRDVLELYDSGKARFFVDGKIQEGTWVKDRHIDYIQNVTLDSKITYDIDYYEDRLEHYCRFGDDGTVYNPMAVVLDSDPELDTIMPTKEEMKANLSKVMMIFVEQVTSGEMDPTDMTWGVKIFSTPEMLYPSLVKYKNLEAATKRILFDIFGLDI